MNALTDFLKPAFSTVDGLQSRYAWAMNLMPFVWMFVLMLGAPAVLAYSLDVPWNAPMNMAPWGWWLAVMLLCSFVAGICAGWLFGTAINVVGAKMLLRWTWRKAFEVFWQKNVSPDWRLPEWRGDNSFGLREAHRQWDERRRKGVMRGVMRHGLPWAVMMFVAVGLFPILNNPDAYEWSDVAFRALIWTVCGALFGLVMWLTESRPK